MTLVQKKCLLLIVLLFGVATSPEAWTKPSHWPSMASQSYTIPIDFRASHTVVNVNLRSRQGSAIYRLVCFSGRESEALAVDSGGLLCGLAEKDVPNSALLSNRTLLSGTDPALYTRGSFNPEELVGACAGYPDYGVSREFRLRGFRLTITIAKLQVAPTYHGGASWRESFDFDSKDRRAYPLGKASLEITVTPDRGSVTKYAKESKYADPKGVQEVCEHRLGS